MAKAGEKNQVTQKSPSRSSVVSNHNENSLRHPYALMVEDIFFRPHFAFESYVNQDLMGGRDIWKLHIILSFFAPIALVVQNFILSIYGFIVHRSPIAITDITGGALKVWLFFVGMIVLIRFADLFRVYYTYWDRSKNWDPPTPWLMMIAFLPFTASGMFFILPVPLNLLFLGIAFLYSLHLTYQAMQNISGYTNKDFLSFVLQFMIFLTFCSAVLLGAYNLYRTVRA